MVAEMQALEGKTVFFMSFAHGFPGVTSLTSRSPVVADGDSDKAQQRRDTLVTTVVTSQQTAKPYRISTCSDKVEGAIMGSIVLADVADNAGGGAPSDQHVLHLR